MLPQKIDNPIHVAKLYSIYFEYLSRMYLYVPKEIPETEFSLDLNHFRESALYKSYKNSNTYSNFAKVYELVGKCRILGIEADLYNVLDLLWIKNIEYISIIL